jgi:pheromone shutdown-related protein TraB
MESEITSVPGNDADGGEYSEDVHRVEFGGREFILVGTAHVSRESAELVREVIQREKPDHVCVELDDQRYQALLQKSKWENLDLRQIIRQRQMATLLMNLLLSSFQRKIGDKLGVLPGTELLEATRAAEEAGIPFSLCDRNVRITMLRAWRSMSLFQRSKMFGALLAGVVGGAELSEDELRELRKKDVLSEVMQQLATAMPGLKRVLIDERDLYLAEKIRSTAGQRIVAVVGAGHVEGITRLLSQPSHAKLEKIEQIPPVTPVWKYVGWGIPLIIIGSLGFIGWTKGGEVAGESLRFWILANGIPSGIGAIVALAHPLTVLTAFVAAPITSLTPVIGAGYVTAFVQAYVRPPRVHDFQTVTEDAGSARRWWQNRLLRVLLAFIFPTLGSMIGTYLGGYEIISNLF